MREARRTINEATAFSATTPGKDYVRFALIDAAPDAYARELRLRMAQLKKPIDVGESSASMNIKIHWAARNHADPDNCCQGIAQLRYSALTIHDAGDILGGTLILPDYD